MSQEVISHKVRRTCDGCGYVIEYEMTTATPEQMEEMSNWFAVGQKRIVDGRPTQITFEAHTIECIPAASIRLVSIPEQVEDPVDIASLRVNRLGEN